MPPFDKTNHNSRQTMNIPRIMLTAMLSLMAGIASAQSRLDSGHADIGIAYENGAFNLHVHDETHDIEYAPPSGGDGAVLVVGASAQSVAPSAPGFEFLGASGDPVWILPKNQDAGLLFLGIGAEELEPGTFEGDRVRLTLRGLHGPGNLAVYDVDAFGTPTVALSSRDGISADDWVEVIAGSHTHLNWAFSAPGHYTVDFTASGTLSGGGQFIESLPTAYSFEVIPEPSSMAFLCLGALGLLLHGKGGATRRISNDVKS